MSRVVDFAYPGRGSLVGAFEARAAGQRFAAARQRASNFRVAVRVRCVRARQRPPPRPRL